MPTYDYECEACGHNFEKIRKISDDSEVLCPKCGAVARRLISGGAGLLFKGSGFYITDYRSDSYKKAKEKESGKSDKSESGSKSSASPSGEKKGGGEKGSGKGGV